MPLYLLGAKAFCFGAQKEVLATWQLQEKEKRTWSSSTLVY
jgi:hypothetical protein